MELIAVDVMSLIEEEKTQSPIVVLYDKQADRVLPIWIGEPEARAIGLALNKITSPRPMTHQLLINTLHQLGFVFSRVVIHRMDGQTYFATITIRKGEQEVEIDARPSDSIALALTTNVPIFVTKDVMDKAAEKNPFPSSPALSEAMRQEGPRKLVLSKEDVKHVSEMLQKAREREEQSY